MPEITGVTTIDGDKKNIDGEVFNNPFQLPATRNGGQVDNDGGGGSCSYGYDTSNDV